MRNPLWILNLGIAFLLILTLGIIYFMQRQLPTRKSLTPASVVLSPKKGISSIDLSRIYENDLFKTYQRPIRKAEAEGAVDLTFPLPPPIKPAPRLQPPRVQFLDPLKINLKGIISVGDENDNRVIIEDEKTKKEELYAVGDTIEDSEILRIDSNKVIFIRSNGQEEIVFLSAQDAAADPLFSHDEPWNTVVQKVSNTAFTIDSIMLKTRITNPAELMDMLDLTIAIKNDKPIGCRVGIMAQDSIGHALGFVYGDVITSVNGLPVSITKERAAVYQSLKKALPAKVRVKILRHDQELEFLYVLKSGTETAQLAKEHSDPAEKIVTSSSLANSNDDPQLVNEPAVEERIAVGRSSQPPASFAQAQKRDKLAMRQMGGRSALIQRNQK